MDESSYQNQSIAQQQQNPPSHFEYSANTNVPPKKTFLKIVIVIFLALVVLTGTATVMFAYGVIPIGTEKLRDRVANIIMKIPFMPKTSRYVLLTSAEAHQKVTRMSIDASLATSGTGFGGMFGAGSLDAQAKGSFDYTNPDSLIASFNLRITKDFDVDIKVLHQKAYFKINSFPSLIEVMLSSFGIPEDTLKEISDKWFYYDLTSLDTEARQNLREQQEKIGLKGKNQKLIEVLNNKDIAKGITMNSDKLDGLSVFHIVFKPTDKSLDLLWKIYDNSSSENISKSIKNFTLDAWIDEKDYFVRNLAVGFAYIPPKTSYSLPSIDSMGLPLSQKDEVPVSFVMKFADFGQQVQVTPPQNPIKFEDFLKTIMTSYATQSGSLSLKQFSVANNTKRKSDINSILNALSQYSADHSNIIPPQISYTPKTIATNGANLCSIIVPAYLYALPVDPSISEKAITTCSNSYNTGYFIQKIGNKITVSAPKAENDEVISVTR